MGRCWEAGRISKFSNVAPLHRLVRLCLRSPEWLLLPLVFSLKCPYWPLSAVTAGVRVLSARGLSHGHGLSGQQVLLITPPPSLALWMYSFGDMKSYVSMRQKSPVFISTCIKCTFLELHRYYKGKKTEARMGQASPKFHGKLAVKMAIQASAP